MLTLPPTLLTLWRLTGNSPGDAGSEWNTFFDPIGMILHSPRNEGYWCTPVNSLTFASTGCDGTHYGLVATEEGTFTDFSPVVMTVPMSDAPNLIVGANLREFLCLGCRRGYVALDGLVLDRKNTVRELSRFNPERGEHERRLFDRLTTTFRLKPWTDPERRLAELERVFASTLQLLVRTDGTSLG